MEEELVVLTNCQLVSGNDDYHPTLPGFAKYTSQPKPAGNHSSLESKKKPGALPQGNHSGAVLCWKSPAMHHIMLLIAKLQTPAISEHVTRKKIIYKPTLFTVVSKETQKVHNTMP